MKTLLDTLGLHNFLREYPNMAIRPTDGSNLVLRGKFEFSAKPENGDRICDAYKLTIEVPDKFPKELPIVMETDKKIPRDIDYHVNTSDGTLCLGSRLRLLLKLSQKPTLSGFAEDCLVPYLYAISYKIEFGKDFPFGELPHGHQGELQDYVTLFELDKPEQAHYTLQLLGMKKRDANKNPCPCGCGRRLGKCQFNEKIQIFRNITDRKWIKKYYSYSFSDLTPSN